MRSDDQPADICVRNISTRGLMIQCAAPPARGAYVEIAFGAISVVGRVAWTNHRRAGIQTREHIDVATLLGAAAAKASAPLADLPRPARARGATITGDDARVIARRMQFIFLLICVVALGAMLASTAHGFLSGAMREITSALPEQ
jgi:hypothetical protein